MRCGGRKTGCRVRRSTGANAKRDESLAIAAEEFFGLGFGLVELLGFWFFGFLVFFSRSNGLGWLLAARSGVLFFL